MCEWFFGPITGGGGSVNTGVLQNAGGVALDGTLRFVQDQNGTNSILRLSTTEVEILPANNVGMKLFQVSAGATGIGASSLNCIAFDGGTIYGLGAFQFFTGGATQARINSNGVQIGPDTTTQNGSLTIKSAGGNIASYRDSSNVEVGYIDGTGKNKATEFLSNDLNSGSLITAKPMKFGDKATITDAGLTALGLDAQIAIEHNGQVYYIPVGTAQFS